MVAERDKNTGQDNVYENRVRKSTGKKHHETRIVQKYESQVQNTRAGQKYETQLRNKNGADANTKPRYQEICGKNENQTRVRINAVTKTIATPT